MTRFTRRTFGKSAVMVAAGSAWPSSLARASKKEQAPGQTSERSFPTGFLWGAATASYQTEGAVKEDGRGASIWDTFSHSPGKTFHGETGDIADDSYHRYREDIAIMKTLGLTAFRFSVAWPRIFPQGTGQPNAKGMDFYKRYTDALREAGIQPFCTLYHWDLPQAMEDRGGWRTKDTAKAFADYARYVVGQLGDRVSHYMTMNEMGSFINSGYGGGRDAPSVKLPRQEFAQAKHWALFGHGLAVEAIRAVRPLCKVGCAEGAPPIIPAFNAPEHIAAARKAYVEENAEYLTAIHTGKYTEAYLRELGADAPVFTAEEMKTIATPTDFQGLNIYSATPVRAADNERGYVVIKNPASYPHMASSWLTLGPEALYWSPKLAAETFGIKTIYITENGCSADDVVAEDGEIYDTDRVMYLNAYLTQLQRGVSEGVPVKGYFLWSLLDNYEWSEGYSKRFGITYVDFPTQKRTPKLSAKFYRKLIARNGL